MLTSNTNLVDTAYKHLLPDQKKYQECSSQVQQLDPDTVFQLDMVGIQMIHFDCIFLTHTPSNLTVHTY